MMKKLIVLIYSIFLLIMPTSCMYDLDNSPTIGGNTTVVPENNKLKFYTGSIQSMHTFVKLNLFAESNIVADNALRQVKRIFDKYDVICDAELNKFVNEFTGKPYDENTIKNNILKENTSELAKLNYYRHLDNASNELIEILKFAEEMKKNTDGYFNPYLGYLNLRWKSVIDGIRKPELNSMGENYYYSDISKNAKIIIEGNSITLTTSDTHKGDQDYEKGYLVDLGGIAKGYATEKANQYLHRNFDYYLLNAGSSNIACNKFNNKNDKNWNIDISYPLGYPNLKPVIKKVNGYYEVDGKLTNIKVTKGDIKYGKDSLNKDLVNKYGLKVSDVYFDLNTASFYEVLSLSAPLQNIGSLSAKNIKVYDKAVVTSSPQQQHVMINNKMYHHILDPFTGAPTDISKVGKEGVTIVGNDSGMLDAYSTALFAMPLEEAKEFALKNKLHVYFMSGNNVIEVGDNYE